MKKRGRGVPDLIIACGALACAAVVLRAMRLDRISEDVWLFSLLVVLPGALTGALMLALLSRSERRVNIAMLVVTTGLSLLALEGALFLMPSAVRAAGARRTATAPPAPLAERRSRTQFVRDLRAQGVDASITITSAVLRGELLRGERFEVVVDGRRVLPLGNIANRVTVHCNESGTYSIFQSDEHGFNNPPGSWTGPLDLAAVGDSFVQGACVAPSETLAANLRTRFPRTLGLGMDGFGPLSQLALIKEYLPPLRPRNVVWFYYEGNDLSNLGLEAQVDGLRAYLGAHHRQGLAQAQAAIDSALSLFIDRVLAPGIQTPPPADDARRPPPRPHRAVAFATLYELRATLGLNALAWRAALCCDVDLFTQVLADAEATVQAWGGRLHFVYLPTAARYDRPPLAAVTGEELRARRRVLAHVRALGIPVVDVHRAFAATGHPRALFAGQRAHYNAEGYRVAAEAVIHHLR